MGSTGWARAARQGLSFSSRDGDPVAQGKEWGDLSLCLPRQLGTPLNARCPGRPGPGEPVGVVSPRRLLPVALLGAAVCQGLCVGRASVITGFGGPQGPGSEHTCPI